MRFSTFAAVVFSLFLIVACTNATDNTLKSDGVGPVRLGTLIKDLPSSSEGLYDCIVPEYIEEYDWEGYVYHIKSDGDRIATMTEDCGRIHSIDVFSDKLHTADGFGLHNTVEELLAAGGLACCDNYGFEGILYKGLLFSGMDFSLYGQKKAETVYLEGIDKTFTEEDFIPGTHPTRITIAKWYADAK